VALWVRDLEAGRIYHLLFTSINSTAFLYALVRFVGVHASFQDITLKFQRPPRLLPRHLAHSGNELYNFVDLPAFGTVSLAPDKNAANHNRRQRSVLSEMAVFSKYNAA
jgi:hypothetical protein